MAAIEQKDADISRGCRQNRPEAWRQLVGKYTPLVYRVAYRMLKDTAAAEDAAQEVFIAVHRSITQHDPTRPLGPWLARITYNECLKRLAKSKRIAEREMPEDAAASNHSDLGVSPEEMVGQRQVSETVAAALDRLSAQDRGMIVMRYREGFTDTEIAEAVSMPVGTVKTRLYRARVRLKRYLAPLFREVVS
jgi:RNA polymerase sigma-70 factor (ECF subfamily)